MGEALLEQRGDVVARQPESVAGGEVIASGEHFPLGVDVAASGEAFLTARPGPDRHDLVGGERPAQQRVAVKVAVAQAAQVAFAPGGAACCEVPHQVLGPDLQRERRRDVGPLKGSFELRAVWVT